MKATKKQVEELLTRGVAEVIGKEQLEKALLSGKKLRIKFGIDPTGDLLHLGHSALLLKLRGFQNLGHTVILLIGDHTAEIGDPSGRSKERMPMTRDQIKKNMASYQAQAGKILDMKAVEVRYNSEWYNALSVMEFAQLTSTVTISQILQRADFKKRIQEGGDVSVREAFYPILQGYDSVMLDADVEIGGTDQKFNLLMGRQIQKRYGKKEQGILMMSLLQGLDGEIKMSKTANNYIALVEEPPDMFGKIMALPDPLLSQYFQLATTVPMDEVKKIEAALKKGANPRDTKVRLATEIVALYHGKDAAKKAENAFVALFQKHELPSDIPELVLREGLSIIEMLLAAGFAASKSEARRLIKQGGVSFGCEEVSDEALIPKIDSNGAVLQKGKRHFIRILAK